MPPSKNQRRGSLPSNKGPFMLQGDMRLIIPLQGGYIYLLDPANGHNLHLKLGSEKAATELARVSSLGFTERLTNEINTLAKRYPEDNWSSAKSAIKLN